MEERLSDASNNNNTSNNDEPVSMHKNHSRQLNHSNNNQKRPFSLQVKSHNLNQGKKGGYERQLAVLYKMQQQG